MNAPVSPVIPVVTMTIQLNSDGIVVVTGVPKDKVIAAGMLEFAKHFILACAPAERLDPALMGMDTTNIKPS